MTQTRLEAFMPSGTEGWTPFLDRGTIETGGPNGLLWNGTMLAEWRRRWTARDTYWSAGDVSVNSPADGQRIDANATAFRNGITQPWQPPDKILNGDADAATEGRGAGLNMRDCAFRALITEDENDVVAVRSHLISEIRQPWMDVDNSTWWDQTTGAYGDANPLFVIAELWTRYTFAYACLNYLGGINTSEQTEIGGVLEKCAGLCSENMATQNYLNFFIDRAAGTIDSAQDVPFSFNGSDLAYVNGPKIALMTHHLNNRRMAMNMLVGVVGAMWGNTTLISDSEKLTLDWLRFGIYRDGTLSDFYRETSTIEELGLTYSASPIATAGVTGLALKLLRDRAYVIDLADNVGTTTGPSSGPVSDGTSDTGSDISVRMANRMYAKYVDNNVYSRTGVRSGRLIGSGGRVNECQLAVGNAVWGDTYIASVLARTASGVSGWGTTDTGVFQGNGRQLPGFLFMFGGLEGAAV